MTERDERQSVYEIGYLVADTIAEEHVPAEADKVRKIVSDAGASIIAEEVPKKEKLAYTMRRKTVAGSYEKYDSAYFGWVKFEVGSDKIEAIKKAIEVIPSVIRMLVISTARENTYLGKRVPVIAARSPISNLEEKPVQAPVQAASIEDMDKSIDDMVKEV